MSTVIELPISTVLQKQLAFGLMQDGMIELVHVCKFQRQRGLVRTWTELIISQPHLVDFIRSADALIPVPMHPQRLRQRGFNQAQLLAQQLAKISQKPHFPRALKKILPTEAQSALNRQQRQANLRNAFVVDFEHLQLPSSAAVVLLLVDDVCTTGATLEACGRTLKTAFPNSTIVALTLAFTPLSAF
jgi:ComF family protein